MKNVFFLLCFAIAILSCNENPCDDISCLNGGECFEGICDCPSGFTGENCQFLSKLLRSVSIDGEKILEYGYDDNDNLQSMISNLSSVFLEHKKDTIISTAVSTQINQEVITYYIRINTDSLIVRTMTNGTLNSKHLLFTNYSEPCGFQKEELIDSASGVTTETKNTTYTDDNCSNTVEYFFNLANVVLMTSKSTLDDKLKYSYSATLPYLRIPRTGNVISYIEMDEDGNINESTSFNSTFTYDEDDYPMVEQRNLLTGSSSTWAFEYY